MSTATAIAPNRESSRGMYTDERMVAALVYSQNRYTGKTETIYRKIAKNDTSNAGAHQIFWHYSAGI